VSDVGAVVLHLNEPFWPLALASLDKQTLSVAQTVVLTGISPFYRALNEAAARMEMPYFVQVDADMQLDPHCVQSLRALMSEDCACVVGHLRDPLMGRIVGVKLFRTRLLREMSHARRDKPGHGLA